jgi:hypothetical protein
MTEKTRTPLKIKIDVAGLDTTTSAIGGSIWHLVQNPGAQIKLAAADAGTWRLALDEFVRWVRRSRQSLRRRCEQASFSSLSDGSVLPLHCFLTDSDKQTAVSACRDQYDRCSRRRIGADSCQRGTDRANCRLQTHTGTSTQW